MTWIYFVSFTDILKQLKKDRYRPLDLARQNVKLVFGGAPVHTVREDGLVPFEVTWLNDQLPSCYGDQDREGNRITGVERSKCDLEALGVWDSLVGIIKEKHEQGLVVWGKDLADRGYHDFCRSETLMGNVCYWRGEVYKVGESR